MRKKTKLSLKEIKDELDSFTFLDCNSEIVSLAFDLMKKHNLKPNDAIILACCKYHGIDAVLSLDDDFEAPAKTIGIKLNSLQ